MSDLDKPSSPRIYGQSDDDPAKSTSRADQGMRGENGDTLAPPDPELARGLFIEPAVFADVRPEMRIAREEIFGPVTVIAPFDDPEAVLEEANDSEYGLAASLWTNNLKIGLDLAHRLEAGLVQINQNLVVQANLSYGGVKSSGLGKEASLEAMLEHFTHKKTIMVNMG